MPDYTIEDKLLRLNLDKEIPILTAQIRALYQDLDKKYHLHGASIPITFGYDRDTLGSYTRRSAHESEHFHFSLLFIGYGVKNPLKKEDRMDLYKHEYAHYMQYNMSIPKEYQWQTGTHGSAWKYCCSLVGAAPTPYYKVGESLLQHDYDKALKNPIHDKTVPIRDQYRREQAYQKEKNLTIHFQPGDIIHHPKYGEGLVEEVNKSSSSVILKVLFDEELKSIDQSWLLRAQKNTKS